MPPSRSALKRLRTSEKERVRNKARLGAIKTLEKGFRAAVADKELDRARQLLPQLLAKLDKAVKVGAAHRNKSARKKAQFSRLLAKPDQTAS